MRVTAIELAVPEIRQHIRSVGRKSFVNFIVLEVRNHIAAVRGVSFVYTVFSEGEHDIG